MRVYTDILALPKFHLPVITIGSFDGLHRGHMHILHQIISEARKINGESVVITFHPHPKMVVGNPTLPLKMLTTIDEKISLLEAAGIENLVIVPFTETFSQMSADDYLHQFLIRLFQPHTIVIGHDHRFGMDRSGGFDLLEKFATNGFFRLIEISEQQIKENAVSSTQIRNNLSEGNINKANLLLGRPYFFTGLVVEGKQLGRTIGFPTANIVPINEFKIIPDIGVYAVWVTLENSSERYMGMMNIGRRPTVSENEKCVLEVHLIDFDQMIYGQKITIFFIEKIRNEIKFDTVESLRRQLESDKLQSIQLLQNHELEGNA